jgi:serine/threonine-protein kinase HipA
VILDLYIAPEPTPAGRLHVLDGRLSLDVRPGAARISLAFDHRRPPEETTLRAWLSNLLPERPDRRQMTAKLLAADPNDVIAMLVGGGQDLMGAVAFRPQGDPPPRFHGNLQDPTHYRRLPDGQIPSLLVMLQRHGALPHADGPDPSPLAGMQPKIALALHQGAFFLPLERGLSPSTHILKTSQTRPATAARFEHHAMRLAARCGLKVADTRLLAYDACGRPTEDPARTTISGILVERFDRRVSPDGRVDRLHQEDFAQALGLFETEKYAHAHGVSADRRFGAERIGRDILSALREPVRGRRDVFRALLFSLAIGNWDFHAKNLAILHGPDGARLAPLYDLDPVALDPSVSDRLAMPVGQATRLADLRRDDLLAFLAAIGHRGNPAPLLDDGARLLRRISAWAAGVRGPGAKMLADLAAANLRHLEDPIGRTLKIPNRDLASSRGGGWLLGS